MEYDLLVHLASEPTATSARPSSCGRYGDSHASRLRRKLNAIGGRWFINVRGVGYRLI